MNRPNAPPDTGRLFYAIQDREDGLVDVYLMPFAGVTLVVRGVALPQGDGRVDAVGCLASDVRARYYAWCESAEVIEIEREE